MKAKDINEGWRVSPELGQDGGLMECPECFEWPDSLDWTEGELHGCEVCGSHDAIKCPKCEDYIDTIHCPKIKTKSRK